MARKTTIISITIDKEFLKELDEYVEKTPFSRSQILCKYAKEGIEKDDKYNLKKVLSRAEKNKQGKS